MRCFIVFVLSLTATLCEARSSDTSGITAADVRQQFSTAYGIAPEPYAYWRAKMPMSEARLRRKVTKAAVLLYTGGACLLAAVPMFIAAHNNRYADTNINGHHNIHPPALGYTLGGGFFSVTGVWLTLSGALFRHKYKRRLDLLRQGNIQQ